MFNGYAGVRSGDDIHPVPAVESTTIMGLLMDTDRARDGPSDMPPRSGLIDQAVITTAQTGDTRQPNEHAGQFSGSGTNSVMRISLR